MDVFCDNCGEFICELTGEVEDGASWTCKECGAEIVASADGDVYVTTYVNGEMI